MSGSSTFFTCTFVSDTRSMLFVALTGAPNGCGAIASDRVTHLVKCAQTDKEINKPAPKKAELKTTQIEASIKSAKAKAKAVATEEASSEPRASASGSDEASN